MRNVKTTYVLDLLNDYLYGEIEVREKRRGFVTVQKVHYSVRMSL